MNSSVDVGEGKAVVLLHGESDSEEMWRPIVPMLASAMRAIVPGGDVRAALDELSIERFAVIAQGEGGAAAQLLAAEDDVDALVLIGSVTSETHPELEQAESRLALREIPILLLWGEDDAIVPAEEAERLADRLPTSTLALVPGHAHDLLETAPETVAPLVFEYLRSRYVGGRHGHAEPGGAVPIALTHRPDPN
ncbi:MAG: alpha/beta hydrolase [Actinomycetota bacterium]|nr:alpha/beta hydrolase [Actinomycetota bacterium]